MVAGESPVRAYDVRVTAHWLLIPVGKYASISNWQVILQGDSASAKAYSRSWPLYEGCIAWQGNAPSLLLHHGNGAI